MAPLTRRLQVPCKRMTEGLPSVRVTKNVSVSSSLALLTVSQAKPSLAKVRSASHFGFDEQSVAQLCRECNFRSYFFVREYFFLRAFQLFYGKLVRWNPRHLRYGNPVFLLLRRFDEALAKTAWMRANALGLTWGFDK